MKKLIDYVPMKNRTHIKALYREGSYISIVMVWEDGFSRSKIADNIDEMKDIIAMLESDRTIES